MNEDDRKKKVFSSYTAQLAIFALHFDALCLVYVCIHHRSRPIKEAPRKEEEENKKGTSSKHLPNDSRVQTRTHTFTTGWNFQRHNISSFMVLFNKARNTNLYLKKLSLSLTHSLIHSQVQKLSLTFSSIARNKKQQQQQQQQHLDNWPIGTVLYSNLAATHLERADDCQY